MPYASLNEAYSTYSESFDGGSTLDSIKNPFHITASDPADDFPDIAANYKGDGYNVKYSGSDEWNVLEDEVPINTTIARTPDQRSGAGGGGAVGVSQTRDRQDMGWNRGTGSVTKGHTDAVVAASPMRSQDIGGIQVDIAQDCSDGTCLKLIGHIMKCPGCKEKLIGLLDLGGNRERGGEGDVKENFMGFQLPEGVTTSKIIFYIILVILLLAIYELLNSWMNRIRGG